MEEGRRGKGGGTGLRADPDGLLEERNAKASTGNGSAGTLAGGLAAASVVVTANGARVGSEVPDSLIGGLERGGIAGGLAKVELRLIEVDRVTGERGPSFKVMFCPTKDVGDVRAGRLGFGGSDGWT